MSNTSFRFMHMFLLSACSCESHPTSCLSFMSHVSSYAHIPPYMHKALPTWVNKKEQKQIKFYEKLSGELNIEIV